VLEIQSLHPKTKQLIDSIIENKRLSNAYLFYGENAELNETLAFYLIKKYQGLSRQNNPDLCILEDEKSIKIDAIRNVQEQCKYGPSSANTFFILIKDAEKITQEAANAFLKTLESPPKNVSIILVSNSLHRLLPTIQSRCQKCFIPNTLNAHTTTHIENYESLSTFIQSPTQHKFSFIDSISKNKANIKALLYAWVEESIVTNRHNTETLTQTIKRFDYNVNARLQLEAMALSLV
jgi:hypothetical protein